MYASAAFGDEITPVITDQAGGYFGDFRHQFFPRALNGYVLQIGVMGHPWHEGVRAVQQIAPKSIRQCLKSYPLRGVISVSASRHNFTVFFFGSPSAMNTRYSTR